MAQMRLGELIKALEGLDPSYVIRPGFGAPDSYRGYYDQVAFAPLGESTAGEMLGHAQDALAYTFEGYKGGTYRYNENTACWLASWGNTGVKFLGWYRFGTTDDYEYE